VRSYFFPPGMAHCTFPPRLLRSMCEERTSSCLTRPLPYTIGRRQRPICGQFLPSPFRPSVFLRIFLFINSSLHGFVPQRCLVHVGSASLPLSKIQPHPPSTRLVSPPSTPSDIFPGFCRRVRRVAQLATLSNRSFPPIATFTYFSFYGDFSPPHLINVPFP